MVKLRTIKAILPEVYVMTDESSIMSVIGQQWEVITFPGLSSVAVCKEEIDLAGYKEQKKSWFTGAVKIQGLNYPMSDVTHFITIHDIVTEQPLTDNDLSLTQGNWTPGTTFGVGVYSLGLQNIIYGRVRLWGCRNFSSSGAPVAGSNQLANQMIMAEDFYGTNNGTARDKLYCYRVIGFAGLEADSVTWVGSNAYVLSGAVDKEEDLEYFMRLKRSYETAPPFS